MALWMGWGHQVWCVDVDSLLFFMSFLYGRLVQHQITQVSNDAIGRLLGVVW